MIIGLTGLKYSGKDTAAAYLIKQHGFERKAFADPLKRSLALLLDIPFHQVEEYKNDPAIKIFLTRQIEELKEIVELRTFTFREALQRYGTEAHRDVFGKDFWLDATLPVGPFYGGRAIVVTDVRYQNEADRIRELGGKMIRIDRPDLVDTTTRDIHRSETELMQIKIDAVVPNISSIEDLHRRLEWVLDEILAR